MLPRLEPTDSRLLKDIQSLINETDAHPTITVWATINAEWEVHIWMRRDGGEAQSIRVESVKYAKRFLGALFRFAEHVSSTKVQPPDDVVG